MKGAVAVLAAALVYAGMGWSDSHAANVQFSAEAVQVTPEKKAHHSRIFVGDNKVRLEYGQGEQARVEIYDIANQRAYLLMPARSAYLERSAPPGGMMNPMLPPAQANPCAYVPNAVCRQLGQETLEGRTVVKWEMDLKRDGQTKRSLLWMDQQRLMPIRQLWPDGTLTEMHFKGRENLNGRQVERWEMVATQPTGQSMTSTQWYDPALKIAIREELPGGYYRELRNIRLGRQPDELFRVPPGYHRMTPPPQAAPAQPGSPPAGRPYPRR